MIVTSGADVAQCPTCGAPLSRAHQGRNTRRWLRHCLNPNGCKTTTVSDDPPNDRRPVHDAPIFGYYAGELPLVPVAAVASSMRAGFDARMRQTGEREPGEDD